MNKVILIGNVGKDPDVKYYSPDQSVVTVSLATTEKGYTLQNGTRVPDRTDWHTLIFYRRLAKVVEKYVHKGDKLYVDGRLQYRSYDDKRGIQRNVTEIIVDNMEMLTPRAVSNNQVEVKNSNQDSLSTNNDMATAVDDIWKENNLQSQEDNISPF